MCVYMKESRNVTFVNNTITKCTKYGIAAYDKTDLIRVKSNFLTDIK